MSSYLNRFSAGAQKDYIARSGQDAPALHRLHPCYQLSNDHQNIAAALHLYNLGDVGQHREGSDHTDHLARLPVLQNAVLQGSAGACIEYHKHSGSELSSEVAFNTAGARSTPSWTSNAQQVLPSQAAEYMNSTGLLLAMAEGAAEIQNRRLNIMDMEDMKTIHLTQEALNANNLPEQQQAQRGHDLPSILVGRHGERIGTRPYAFSADLRVSQDQMQRNMGFMNADNIDSLGHYAEAGGGQRSETLDVYRCDYMSRSNNEEVMYDVQKSSCTEYNHILLSVDPNREYLQAARRNEWVDNGNLTSGTTADHSQEIQLLSRLEAAKCTAIPGISNILADSVASNSAPSAVGADHMKSTIQLLHRSSLHDHSTPLNIVAYPLVHAVHPPGELHQFDINPELPIAERWDEQGGSRFKLQQETAPKYTASFLSHVDNHQKALPADPAEVGLSLYLESGSRAGADQHMRPPSSDLLSLDFTYSRTGSTGGVLRSSKYLRAAQQLLEEFCNVDRHSSGRAPQYGTSTHDSQPDADPAVHAPNSAPTQQLLTAEERCQLQIKKARLIGMVEELDRRYQQYREQMQLIVTSFESATGMGAAAPYTALARKLISRQFRALRDTIAKHIQVACRSLGEDISSVPVLNKGETPRLRILDQRMRHHRTLLQVGMLSQQHQVWRPQRGLPERSVGVLRAWLFEHFLHPYPKDSEKLMLARLSGLTKSQVSNWFINARVRLWKPMVEQMYTKERKETEPQNEAPAAAGHEDGGNCVTAYASSSGSHGNSVMAEAMRIEYTSVGQCCPKPQHYQHLTHADSNTVCASHHSNVMTKHGVSLTLALQQSSSAERPITAYIDPDTVYHLQPAARAEANYNMTDAFG